MLKSNLSLDLNYNLNSIAIESLFKPIISEFLHCQIGFVEPFKVLEAESYISSYDFKDPQKSSMEHIYLSFLDRISRFKESLDIPISVFITFDKRQCSNYCSDSGRYFSSIKVGGVSKVYYILFTTDELFDFLYSKERIEKITRAEKILVRGTLNTTGAGSGTNIKIYNTYKMKVKLAAQAEIKKKI